MLLTLLLAVLDDAVGADARRAASHEVARRMGIGWRPERETRTVPPAIRSIYRIVQAIDRAAFRGSLRTEAEKRVLAQIAEAWLSGGTEAPFSILWPVLVPIPDSDRIRALYWGAADTGVHERERVVYTSIATDSGWTHTPNDPLFAALADAVEAEEAKCPTDPTHQLHQIDPISIRDWWTETRADLTSKTWPEIIAAMEAWHTQMRGTIGYGKPIRDGLVVLRWPSGVTLQRLLTKRDFAAEGASMGHCVGGGQDAHRLPNGDSDYWRKTRDGLGAVYSLRAPNGVPAATFEVWFKNSILRKHSASNPWVVVTQIQGPDDDEVQSFDGKGLDGNTFLQDPLPYLIDALVLLGLQEGFSTDMDGPFGEVSPAAMERLDIEEIERPKHLGAPTWFPALSPEERARVDGFRHGPVFSAPVEGLADPDWARLALAPRADLLRILGRAA